MIGLEIGEMEFVLVRLTNSSPVSSIASSGKKYQEQSYEAYSLSTKPREEMVGGSASKGMHLFLTMSQDALIDDLPVDWLLDINPIIPTLGARSG